jgi:mannose/cellobiose epimerase-like protein (N-acyl-D-glucosamine 2-epimerase family)
MVETHGTRSPRGAIPATTLTGMAWLSTPAHARWLEGETDRLWDFGRASRASTGFARLDDVGRPLPGPAELWITCRMTHVYALAHLTGRPGSTALVDHGLAALTGAFHDAEHGGWFAEVDADGSPRDTAKTAYPHAFVVLAAASATVAGRPGARELLDAALAVQERRFWDDAAGMVVEEWDRTFTDLDAYRGVNANMHTVEAYLAAADVTGERVWLDRAARIVERVVHGFARGNAWRIPEHFDATWTPDLGYNADTPAHPFRPYGATIGHWFEWARLALHTRAALTARGDVAPAWLLDDAVALVEAGVREGWHVDGARGFVYTVDWQGRPVVRERMHWVVAEAVAAVAALHAATGDPRWDDLYTQWWEYVGEHVIDRDGGSWWHELGTDNRVTRTVWAGKADLYHAVQATLIPRLPLTPVLAPALAAGLLG